MSFDCKFMHFTNWQKWLKWGDYLIYTLIAGVAAYPVVYRFRPLFSASAKQQEKRRSTFLKMLGFL